MSSTLDLKAAASERRYLALYSQRLVVETCAGDGFDGGDTVLIKVHQTASLRHDENGMGVSKPFLLSKHQARQVVACLQQWLDDIESLGRG